jgi:hypothetical protein
MRELPYVDPPPESLERGPSIPPPEDGSCYYVPGAWVYEDTRWLWRPGFWCRGYNDWVYCPPRYCWTPAGTLFVNGYWDYPLERRGLLFPPVRFPGGLLRADFRYRPAFALNTQAVIGSLWVRPGIGGYAFGDYYGAGYARAGYKPWITYGGRGRDPLFSHYRWVNRNNPSWATGLADLYFDRNRGTAPRPAPTLAAQQKQLASGRPAPASLRVVQPLNSTGRRLARVSAGELTASQRYTTAANRASVERRTFEASRTPRTTRQAPLALARFPTPGGRDTVEPEGTGGRLSVTPRTGGAPPRASVASPSAGRSAPTTSAARPATTAGTSPASRPSTSTPSRLTSPPLTTPRVISPAAGRAVSPTTPRPAAPRPAAPRLTSPPPATPRVITPSSGRTISPAAPRPAAPRPAAPAPRPSVPRSAAPSSPPRMSAPSMPRFSLPPAPRFSAPAGRAPASAGRAAAPAARGGARR